MKIKINFFYNEKPYIFAETKKTNNMEKIKLSIPEQIRVALDGRTQRWLSFETRIPEPDVSEKMKGRAEFTKEELAKIEARLKFKIDY